MQAIGWTLAFQVQMLWLAVKTSFNTEAVLTICNGPWVPASASKETLVNNEIGSPCCARRHGQFGALSLSCCGERSTAFGRHRAKQEAIL